MPTPLNRIILLSLLLAAGFLLIVLSCALYGNWRPLFDIALFLLAPLPNAVCGNRGGYDDFLLGAASNTNAIAEFGQWCTGFLVVSGLALPLVLFHNGLITPAATAMSTLGGLTIYGSIIVFGMFFRDDSDDEFEF